jgi:hypothetical protein
VVTLPFALDVSDLAIRPAFLALLDAWTEAARARRVPQRGDVGTTWTFPVGHLSVMVAGGEEVASVRDGTVQRVSPPRLGLYQIDSAGRPELRVAAPVEREVDLRPRRLAPAAATHTVGDTHASVDASPGIAVVLLLLVTAELLLRLRAGQKAEAV